MIEALTMISNAYPVTKMFYIFGFASGCGEKTLNFAHVLDTAELVVLFGSFFADFGML